MMFPVLLATLLPALFVAVPPAGAQVASPLQSGHYSATMMNVRDMAYPPSGVFVLWYNSFIFSSSFIDRNGTRFERINLSNVNANLPDIDVNLDLNVYASVPTVFWASHFAILGGARYLLGIAPSYVSADVSAVTERAGIANPDTTIIRHLGGTNSGFSDLFVTPVGLSWARDGYDMTVMYSFYAPTGKYEPGAEDAVGLGFWTHQLQARGYYYPRSDKATAIMAGLVYELNGKIEDVDVSPGDRLTFEWGLSQYLSERFEVSAHGGHNWQITDDTGDDVYWDASYHDRKSTVAFGATYWPWAERLAVTGKYSFDFAVRQRFENDSFLLNVTFVPNWLTGS